VLLGKARIHAENLGGKQRRLVAARARANFQNHVLLVVGILGQQQHLDLFFKLRSRGSSVAISSSAMARRSASLSASIARASANPWRTCFSSRYFLTGSSISRSAWPSSDISRGR
jgi:tryptophan synthase beta subunit